MRLKREYVNDALPPTHEEGLVWMGLQRMVRLVGVLIDLALLDDTPIDGLLLENAVAVTLICHERAHHAYYEWAVEQLYIPYDTTVLAHQGFLLHQRVSVLRAITIQEVVHPIHAAQRTIQENHTLATAPTTVVDGERADSVLLSAVDLHALAKQLISVCYRVTFFIG